MHVRWVRILRRVQVHVQHAKVARQHLVRVSPVVMRTV